MRFPKPLLDMLRELIDLIGEDNVHEVEIERRFLGGRVRVSKSPAAPLFPMSATPPADSERSSEERGSESSQIEDADGLHPVSSPMVGMFYRAPSPESPPFVEEGDEVAAGQTVCIIEAMKIMNEIESDIRGRVVRVLVENGSPVEYNTPLILLEPL